jgi:uncharacterized protein YkwD
MTSRMAGGLDMGQIRIRLLGLVAAALVVAVAATGCQGLQADDMVQRVAAERAARGEQALQVDAGLSNKAQAWAEHLAAIRSLAHSVLTADVPPGWRSLAENVGSATSTDEMHRSFMASAPHRANILAAGSDRIGVGVATGSDGRIYVVEEFGAY